MCKNKYADVCSMWARIRRHVHMPAYDGNEGYACECTHNVAYGIGCTEHVKEQVRK